MALARDRCICVRKLEYSETSQILTLFGRDHGLFKVIAKGAHRRTKAGSSKFDGGADLLDVGEAVFTYDLAKDLNTLTEWKQREGYLPLRANLRGMYLGLFAAELVANLIEEGDPHPELFQRLARTLFELGTDRREEAFISFVMDLMQITGNLSDFRGCVACGRPAVETGTATFSPSQGGLLCGGCEAVAGDRIKFDARLLRLIRQMIALPRIKGVPQRLPRLSRHQTDPLNRLFSQHLEQVLGKRMRLVKYVSG